MTNKDNFISKIDFELSKTKWFDGSRKDFTTTWEAVDKEFKTDKNIGSQLRKTNFFEDYIPNEIKLLDNDLEKAKAVYSFIQNHFTWNEKYSIFKNVKVKKAFEEKIGNIGEINISLINSLKAVGLNTELVVLSTRNNGFATKLHPVISDFNYLIAKVNINDTYYFLDASDKMIPFGILPFRCLNGYGRVMDFENPSYWIDIEPKVNSKKSSMVLLELKENGVIEGKLRTSYSGYQAINRRKEIESMSNDAIMDEFENDFSYVEILNYSSENKTDIDKNFNETFEILIEPDNDNTNWYLNPYFGNNFIKNPFNQKMRLYPVDFGYKRSYDLKFTIILPDNYEVTSIPKSLNVTIPDKSFKYNLRSQNQSGVKVSLISSIKINKNLYYSKEYRYLKYIFDQIVNSQKERIVLKNINLEID